MNINHIGLSVLSLYKRLSQKSVDIDEMKVVNSAISHEGWEELVQQYVSPEGKVNYRGFAQARPRLQQYLQLLSDNPPHPDTWTEKQQLAYWINAYNAFTVELILQHYPTQSIQDIAGSIPMINSAWDLKFFKIGGVDFDLNTIEHEILRKQFSEPRIHFAINCASVSCPILLNEAYKAATLEAQLQARAIYFINNPQKNRIQAQELQLSSIFNWFEKDFTKTGTVVAFINQFSELPIDPTAKVSYLEYDWNLNE
ncbi:MAG: DUF547 domain-containing protein [Bacteroidota bacterium]